MCGVNVYVFLQSDCLIFWLLSTVTAGLLAVCIVGTQYFVIEGNKFGKLDPALRKEEGVFDFFSFFFFILFSNFSARKFNVAVEKGSQC